MGYQYYNPLTGTMQTYGSDAEAQAANAAVYHHFGHSYVPIYHQDGARTIEVPQPAPVHLVDPNDPVWQASQGTISATQPTLMDSLTGAIHRGLSGMGISDQSAERTADQTGDLLGATPVGAVSDALRGAGAAYHNFMHGRPDEGLGAAAGASLAALGAIPGEGAAADVAENAAGRVLRASDLPGPVRDAISQLSGVVGGPGGKLTARQVRDLSENYLQHVAAGAPAADWYQNAGRSMMEHFGESEPDAVRFAGATGVTSAGTDVQANLEHAIRGNNQIMAGQPVSTGRFPQAMGRDIQSIYSAPDTNIQQLRDMGDASPYGPKRTPFMQQNLMYEGNDTSNARAVHDVWDARARGYTNPDGSMFNGTPGAPQHKWMDTQDQGYLLPEANRRQLGGRQDWDTGRTQAAAWVGNKIDALVAAGKSPEEAAQIAKTDYSDVWDRTYANHSWESAPGSNTGHMQGFDDLPWSVRDQYHGEQKNAFLNSDGRSKIALGYGMPTGRSYDSTGLYEGVMSPGTQDLLGVARATGSQLIDPSSAALMNATASTHGLLGAQKAAAWNYLSPAKASGVRASGFHFDLGRTLQPADIEKLGPKIQAAFPDGGVGLLPSPNGMRMSELWPGGAGEPGSLAKFVAQARKEDPSLPKPFPTTHSGNYIENSWETPEGRYGAQYVNGIHALNIPNIGQKFDSFAPGIAQRLVSDIDPTMMHDAGLTGSGDIERLRKTIANEGWAGLNKLIRSSSGSAEAKTALLASLAGGAVLTANQMSRPAH